MYPIGIYLILIRRFCHAKKCSGLDGDSTGNTLPRRGEYSDNAYLITCLNLRTRGPVILIDSPCGVFSIDLITDLDVPRIHLGRTYVNRFLIEGSMISKDVII